MNDFVRQPQRPSPQPAPAQTKRPYALPKVKAQPARGFHIPEWLKNIVAVPAFIVIALLIQSPALGQLVAAGYVIYAFVWRVPSRTSFALALGCVVTMAWILLIQGNVVLAQAFGTYTFWLLVAGVICLGRELKKEGGRVYSIRQNQKKPY